MNRTRGSMSARARVLTQSVASMAAFLLLQASPLSSQNALPNERGVGHRRLDSLAGSWDVAVRFRYGDGPERTGRARLESAWTLDGQDYNAESGQVTLQFYGFDNQRGTYYLIKFDNFDTGVLHAEGAASSDGRTITTVGDRIDPVTGKAAPLRVVLKMVDPDHFNVEWYTRQPDGTEQRTVLMEHTRRPQAPR